MWVKREILKSESHYIAPSPSTTLNTSFETWQSILAYFKPVFYKSFFLKVSIYEHVWKSFWIPWNPKSISHQQLFWQNFCICFCKSIEYYFECIYIVTFLPNKHALFTSVLIFGFWIIYHLISIKLKQKQLLLKAKKKEIATICTIFKPSNVDWKVNNLLSL